MFIETHAHLNLNKFDDDRDDVILRAKSSKIEKIINVGIDIITSEESIALAEKYDFIFAAAGMHPNDAAKAPANYLEIVEAMLSHDKVVALGEIGLDYYWDFCPKNVQHRVLIEQLNLSISKDMPVIIHTRNAWPDILEILEGDFKGKLKGVFHCFSGDIKQVHKVIDLGFYISFTGVVTFKNSNAIEILKEVPLERLLLETDCPFMAPTPYRGKRCESSYIPLIAETITKARNIQIEKLASVTSENAKTLFGFK